MRSMMTSIRERLIWEERGLSYQDEMRFKIQFLSRQLEGRGVGFWPAEDKFFRESGIID